MVPAPDRQWTGFGPLLVGGLLVGVFLVATGVGIAESTVTTAVEPNNTTESTTTPDATVSGQTGAPLPTDPETGNPILAVDQTQTIRIELQAANGTLGRTGVRLQGPLAYMSETLTARVDSSELIRPPVDPAAGGQRGFVTVDPIENGTGVVHLMDESGDDRRPLVGPDEAPIVFDVRPARPLAVDLSTTSPPRGGPLEVRVTTENGAGLDRAPVTLVDPDGDVRATRRANADGRASLSIPADAAAGNWSVEVRSAGFDPVAVRTQLLVVGDSARHAKDLHPRSPGYEDVDGDGSVDVSDVLTYLQYRERRVVRNDPRAFDFDGDGRSGTVFDAVALFVRAQ